MTDLLEHTLSTRADRAHPIDADEFVAVVRDLAQHRTRRRRATALSASGAVAVVLAAVAVSVALGPSPHHASAPPAGQPAASTPDEAVALVPIAPAPAGAEVSLGEVPDGWTYEGFGDEATTYLAPGAATTGPDWFVGKIAVMVGQRYDSASAYTLTIAGRPAKLSAATATEPAAVDLLVPDRDGVPLAVTIQVPAATELTHDQIVELADSIDIRSTEHYGVG